MGAGACTSLGDNDAGHSLDILEASWDVRELIGRDGMTMTKSPKGLNFLHF